MFDKIKLKRIEKKLIRAIREDKRGLDDSGAAKFLVRRYGELYKKDSAMLHIDKDKNISPMNFAILNNNDKYFYVMLREGFNCSVPELFSHIGAPSYGQTIKVSPIGLSIYLELYHNTNVFKNYIHFAYSLMKERIQPCIYDLYYAVKADYFQLAQYIIQKCPDGIKEIKKDSKYFNTIINGLLDVAAEKNDYELVKLLLEKVYYDYPKIQNLCSSAVYSAIKNDNLEMVKLLVDYGANINCCGHQYHTPIFDAIGYNRVNIAKYLIDNGADIERHYGHGWFYSQGNTPLGLALDNDYFNMAKLLIENGATLISDDSKSKHKLEEFLKQNNLYLKQKNEKLESNKKSPEATAKTEKELKEDIRER